MSDELDRKRDVAQAILEAEAIIREHRELYMEIPQRFAEWERERLIAKAREGRERAKARRTKAQEGKKEG